MFHAKFDLMLHLEDKTFWKSGDLDLTLKGYPRSNVLMVCWSLTSLCHSNGHIETMPAREFNPFTALTRIRSQFLRTQCSTSNHQRVDMTTPHTAQPSGLAGQMSWGKLWTCSFEKIHQCVFWVTMWKLNVRDGQTKQTRWMDGGVSIAPILGLRHGGR